MLNRKKRAFSLVELIIVIVLIGILAGIASMRIVGTRESAFAAEAYSVLASIASAQSAYYAEHDVYAADFASLDRFSSTPQSENFTYSAAVTSSGTFGYVKATKIAGRGNNDYYMCVNGGQKGTSALTCN